MKELAHTNGIQTVIEEHSARLSKVEDTNLELVKQSAHLDAQFDSLNKNISDKFNVVLDKIDAVDCKVDKLESRIW